MRRRCRGLGREESGRSGPYVGRPRGGAMRLWPMRRGSTPLGDGILMLGLLEAADALGEERYDLGARMAGRVAEGVNLAEGAPGTGWRPAPARPGPLPAHAGRAVPGPRHRSASTSPPRPVAPPTAPSSSSRPTAARGQQKSPPVQRGVKIESMQGRMPENRDRQARPGNCRQLGTEPSRCCYKRPPPVCPRLAAERSHQSILLDDQRMAAVPSAGGNVRPDFNARTCAA